MFSTIFRYELRFWLRQPSVYIYALFLLLISAVTMGGTAGAFDEQGGVSSSPLLLNSPISIQRGISRFSILLLLLTSIIMGNALYRDFRHQVHTLLYSYPFSKRDYLGAKFLSAFCVLMGSASTIGLGIMIGEHLPGVNRSMLGPLSVGAYLQTYAVYVWPNLLLFGSIVFAVVAFTRNIYAGFITVVIVLLLQQLLGSLLGGLDNRFLAALLDPLGEKAASYYTRYWTVTEENQRLLPVKGVVLYNRLLWLALSGLILRAIYVYFAFRQNPIALRWPSEGAAQSRKKKAGHVFRGLETEVRYDFSFRQHLNAIWKLSNVDFRYLVRSGSFISLVLAGAAVVLGLLWWMNPPYVNKILPVTWKMLAYPAFFFSTVVYFLTFLYTGMLVHRAETARMDQLVDVAPLPNGVFLLAKFGAILKLQVLLLSFLMIGGMILQAGSGYYQFEPGHYLFELYGLHLIHFVIWAMAALFVQNLVTNPYLGTFLLIVGYMGIQALPELGVESAIFRFNETPKEGIGFAYSDMFGYGPAIRVYLLYKGYWFFGGSLLLIAALLVQPRGLSHSFRKRLDLARSRFRGRVAAAFIALAGCFLVSGTVIYLLGQDQDRVLSSTQEGDRWLAENEKRYKRFERIPQPRVNSVSVNLDLFPERRAFRAKAVYTLVNTSAETIDTLLVSYSLRDRTACRFDRRLRLVRRDSFIKMDLLAIEDGLAAGDSLVLHFDLANLPNSWLQTDDRVRANGTYLRYDMFPTIGYRPAELSDAALRRKYGLGEKTPAKPSPADSSALGYSNPGNKQDWINFEAIVSTSADQTAIAPGHLQKEWVENGRRFFHYKTDQKIKHRFAFCSARYEVRSDYWNDVKLQVFYHPGHDANINRIVKGLKAALDYNTTHFSPYRHRETRVVEFPLTDGTYATALANMIPFSEIRFIADVDDAAAEGIDMPFYITVHELSHQWWGNQIKPADVLGSKMLTESLAEYVTLSVLEKVYGLSKLRTFLTYDLDLYLSGRSREAKNEQPLIGAYPDQDYINYRKGALVFYALSDYIGEENLNSALRTYEEKVRFQEPPYTTSLELLDYIQAVVPDSLQYLIKDLFQTITLYDNRISEARARALEDGRFAVDIQFIVRKYRSDGVGNRRYADEGGDSLFVKADGLEVPLLSLPLADYVEVGVFGAGGLVLYLQKHKITRIDNQVTIIVDQAPAEVGIDPYNKLIDTESADNRRKIQR